jgi:hypothetical protein
MRRRVPHCASFLRTTVLTVASQVLLNVSGSVSIDGLATVYHPTTIMVGQALQIQPTASLLVYVTQLPPVTPVTTTTGFFTIPIATFASRQGQFANVTVVMNYPVSRSACYVPTDSSQSYSSSSMSVVVDVQNCGADEGLSSGAIAGIAVGAVVGGVLLVLLIAVLVCFFVFPLLTAHLLTTFHARREGPRRNAQPS